MNKSDLAAHGFTGFVPVSRLRESLNQVPPSKGVYAVLRRVEAAPSFLQTSEGGWFKRKNPTVDVSRLEAKWVTNTEVLYYGKAKNLQERIGALLRFGRGDPVGHRGGRFLWQAQDSADFLIGWKPTPGQEPFGVECELMEEFKGTFGSWPFANIQAPRKRLGGS